VGLEVDIQDGRWTRRHLLNAGWADVGQVQVGLVGSARAKGTGIRSIATLQHRTDLCVLVDKDSPMSQVADLRGKTVVVFVASPWAPFIDVYLKSEGLTRDDVKLGIVDAAALFGAYIAKRADGMMSTTGLALLIAEASRRSKMPARVRRRYRVPELRSGRARRYQCGQGRCTASADRSRAARLGAVAEQSGSRRKGNAGRAAGGQARSRRAVQPDQAHARLFRHAGNQAQADRLAAAAGLEGRTGIDARRWRRAAVRA
jgi:hypothetical protein